MFEGLPVGWTAGYSWNEITCRQRTIGVRQVGTEDRCVAVTVEDKGDT